MDPDEEREERMDKETVRLEDGRELTFYRFGAEE